MIWKRKSKDVIDLTEYYKKQQARAEEMKASMKSKEISKVQEDSSQESSGGMFGFFSAVGSQKNEEDSSYVDMSSGMASAESSEEKRKRFAKRIADMTEKIENLSNQVYRLQQRIDVLERKESGY